MWTESIFQKKYEYKGLLAFGLSIKFIDNGDHEENIIYIESDILPHYIFEKYNILIDEKFVFLSHGYQKPDKNYCADLLDLVAQEILRKNNLKNFFYPQQFLLKNSEIDQKKINYFINCKREVENGKMSIYEKNSPFHLYYISQILNFNSQLQRASKLKSCTISRTIFEEKIMNSRQAELYVDEFHSVSNFKLITHSNTEVLVCALDLNRLIFALNIENKLVEF
jgi:hypothetical protein